MPSGWVMALFAHQTNAEARIIERIIDAAPGDVGPEAVCRLVLGFCDLGNPELARRVVRTIPIIEMEDQVLVLAILSELMRKAALFVYKELLEKILSTVTNARAVLAMLMEFAEIGMGELAAIAMYMLAHMWDRMEPAQRYRFVDTLLYNQSLDTFSQSFRMKALTTLFGDNPDEQAAMRYGVIMAASSKSTFLRTQLCGELACIHTGCFAISGLLQTVLELAKDPAWHVRYAFCRAVPLMGLYEAEANYAECPEALRRARRELTRVIVPLMKDKCPVVQKVALLAITELVEELGDEELCFIGNEFSKELQRMGNYAEFVALWIKLIKHFPEHKLHNKLRSYITVIQCTGIETINCEIFTRLLPMAPEGYVREETSIAIGKKLLTTNSNELLMRMLSVMPSLVATEHLCNVVVALWDLIPEAITVQTQPISYRLRSISMALVRRLNTEEGFPFDMAPAICALPGPVVSLEAGMIRFSDEE